MSGHESDIEIDRRVAGAKPAPRRRAGRRSLVAAVVGLALLPVAGGAPSAVTGGPPADPDLATEGSRRAGPFHLRPFLILKDAGYDDNIRLDAAQPESDTTATAGTGLHALLLTGDRGGFYAYQEFDYVAFDRNRDLNHWNSTTRARGIALMKHLVLSLENRYLSERERPNTEIDQRLRRTNNAVTAALKTRSLGRLTLRARLSGTAIDYRSEDDAVSEAVARRLNRAERTLVAGGDVRLRPKTTLLVEAAVERIAFDDPSLDRDTRANTALAGFRFDPSASIQGELRAGVTALDAPDRSGSDYHGVVGDAALSSRLGHASRVKGTWTRGIEFSSLADNLYYVRTGWRLAFEQFFSRRVSGEVAYGRGLNHYPEPIDRTGSQPFSGIRDDYLTTWELALRYRLNDQLSLVAGGHRLTRNSTDDVNDRERNLYTFGTTYNF